jgi:PKD repeat protein
MKNIFLFCSFFLFLTSHTQTIVWQDDFEIPSAWTLNVQSGLNGPDANLWVISDAEGGMPAGSCGTATNGNKTLHVGCQGTLCVGSGATYNAGDGGLGFMDATTHKRTYLNTNINTSNVSNLVLEFDYIGIGQAGVDYGNVIYSANGGSTWTVLQSITAAPTCPNGQGLWTHSVMLMPINCANIPNLRLGFEWNNDNDGTGTDPSLAINNLKISTTSSQSVSADFLASSTNLCQGNCIALVNNSTGATSSLWDFGNGQTSTLDYPDPLCYSAPGQYTIQLTSCAGTICDTESVVINVAPLLVGEVFVSAFGSYTWPANGITYNASGIYIDTISNANACDSIITLNLELFIGGFDEISQSFGKTIIKITDISGREIERKAAQVVLIYFSDGTIKRLFILD